MSGRRLPGALVVKDPDSTNDPYGMDWTPYLADLGVGVTIAGSTWTLDGPDTDLAIVSSEILPGGLVTQVYLSGGTELARYTVTNHITTNSAPIVLDDRSFVVRVEER